MQLQRLVFGNAAVQFSFHSSVSVYACRCCNCADATWHRMSLKCRHVLIEVRWSSVFQVERKLPVVMGLRPTQQTPWPYGLKLFSIFSSLGHAVIWLSCQTCSAKFKSYWHDLAGSWRQPVFSQRTHRTVVKDDVELLRLLSDRSGRATQSGHSLQRYHRGETMTSWINQ